MNNYTYPVLLEVDSSYKSECVFLIDNVEYSFDETFMNIKFRCKLKSNYLSQLIAANKAHVMITATTIINKQIKNIESTGEEEIISIPIDSLLDNDKVLLEAYILVKEPFTLEYCDEMEEIYKNFKAKEMKKNMQLAVANSYVIYYRRSDDGFIGLSKSPELDGEGLRVYLDDSSLILVRAGEDFCDAFYALSNDSNPVIRTLSQFIVSFIAIYQSLLVINNDNSKLEKIKEYSWYEGLEYLFIKNELSIEEYFEGEDNDVQQLFTDTQKLTKNEFEKTFIKCRELLNGKREEDDD